MTLPNIAQANIAMQNKVNIVAQHIEHVAGRGRQTAQNRSTVMWSPRKLGHRDTPEDQNAEEVAA